jgi:hypothetical protein
MSYRLHRGSVLPRIRVEQTSGGALLRAARPGWHDIATLATFALAFLLLLASALTPRIGLTSQVVLFLKAGGALMVFLGSLSHYLRRRRLFQATLLVRSWPIRLGDDVEVRFRALLKKAAPVSALKATLQCVVEVTFGGGRDQQKKAETLYELDLRPSKWSVEHRKVEEEWTLTIPDALPPSLEVPCNKVQWRVTTLLTTAGTDVPAEFMLLVIPEVAE